MKQNIQGDSILEEEVLRQTCLFHLATRLTDITTHTIIPSTEDTTTLPSQKDSQAPDAIRWLKRRRMFMKCLRVTK